MTAQIEQVKADIVNHGGVVVEQEADIDLLSKGMLIRISVGGTTIFDRRLNFEEIGISSHDTEIREWIRAGTKSYAPHYSAKINSWSTQCRQAVKRYCREFESIEAMTASRHWRFLFFDAYPAFRDRWDELMTMRDDLIADIESEYDVLVEEAVTFYVEQMAKSWDTLQAKSEGITIHFPDTGESFEAGDREQCLEWMEQYVRADFPTMEDIRVGVYADYMVNLMFTSASLEQAAAQEAESRARATQAQLEAEVAADELWRIQTTREAREQAIKQAELERMRERLRQTADPYREAMQQLLAELTGHVQALLDGYAKHGSFRGRSLNRIENMTELWEMMGGRYLDDNEKMEQLIERLQGMRESGPADDSGKEAWQDRIGSNLMDLRGLITTKADELARQMQSGTRAGALEL